MRPDRLPDLSGDDASRVLSGSFSAPVADAGASASGAGGASNCPGSASATCEVYAADASGSSAGTSGSSTAGSGMTVGATGDSPVTLRQTYEAFCDGATVQWGFFTCAASTPGDSSIRFRVRTAPTEEQLPAAAYFELMTASTALRTDRCTFTGPAPCPIDLFDLLGGAPLAHHPLSDLEVVLSPASSDGSMPAVEEWLLNYSCTFNQ